MGQTIRESGAEAVAEPQNSHIFQADGAERIQLPSPAFIADATMTRDGADLILVTPSGETAVIEGYFSASMPPALVSADGGVLTPNLIKAFSHSAPEYAANETANDESPVGAVDEVKGNATVTRADGTVETITIGTPIYQGDVVETDASGAVNISFIDETTMAVSENARLSIDNYTFDPATESGTTNFSVLRGLFVFTSGLIGRDDPDDVSIDTPVGSIGIRGTIIAGDINPGGESSVTVLEGAIVVKNGLTEETLSIQFETIKLGGFDQPMESLGVVPASDISTRFGSISSVSPTLFTTINDASSEQSNPEPVQSQQPAVQETTPDTSSNELPVQQDIVTLSGDTSGFSPIAPAPSLSPTSQSSAAPSSDVSTGSTGLLSPGLTTETQQTSPQAIDNLVNTVPETPPALALTFTNGSISDIATSGTVIGTISTGQPGFTYDLGFSSAYYSLVSTTNGVDVVLTASGANYLASSLDPLSLGSFTVTATHPDNRVIISTFGITTTDNNAATQLNLNGASPAGITLITDDIDNNIGYTITALGDINNDGFDDFAFSNNVDGQNHTYRVYGSGTALPSGDIVNLAGTVQVVGNNTPTYNTSNTVVAGIGDFNGDGAEDYVLGQSQNDTGATTGVGHMTIVSGSDPNDTRTFVTPPNFLTTGEQFGFSVDGAGDFNNDGYADVIVGAPGSTDGNAFFIKGSADGWGSALTTASILSGTTSSAFGSTVTGIGDFNGDGYDDFAVGAPQDGSNNGSFTIYSGNGSGSTTASQTINGTTGQAIGDSIYSLGDINGDGKSDIMIGGTSNFGEIYLGGDITADSQLNIITANYTVSGGGGIGDFNADGYDDFTVSIANATETKAYVVFGKSTINANMDLNFFKDPSNALEIQYNGATQSDALEFSAIGDVNGDGYDDFGIGLPDANGASAGNGGVAIVYGYASGPATGTVGNNGNNTLSDEGLNNVSMRGGAGQDTFVVTNTNFLGIDGGSNIPGAGDKIKAMADLDFTNVNFEKVSNIEKLYFGQNGQSITLTVENLFNLLKTSDTGTLTIGLEGGVTGGSLVLANLTGGDDYTSGTQLTDNLAFLNDATGGSTSVNHSSATPGYDTFNIGGYKLLIDTAIAVDAQ